ncbi:DUF11 domain-containing protein [bacterium]|nr:DUF11 domain-containing protein [bacterium]
MSGQQRKANPHREEIPSRSIASSLLLAGVLLLTGCDDPLVDLCQAPKKTRSKPAEVVPPIKLEPEKIIEKPTRVAPPENRSTAPEPIPPRKPVAPPPERVTPPLAPPPTTMVSKQLPAEPKVLSAEPALITVVPSWFEPSRKRAIEPAQAAIKTVTPKPIGERLELLTLPAKVRLDQHVVAVARLLGPDGKPIVDADVEFLIDRAGVGGITAAGGKEDPDENNYRKSATLARCRTSTTTYSLDRKGLSDEAIVIRPGDAWCVLQSASPGDLILTAHSTDIVHAERCQATHRMHWYEAELQLEPTLDVVGTEATPISARILNAKGETLAGYPVRFEVIDRSSSNFSNNAQAIERSSDSAGTASTSLRPNAESASSSKVRVQLFSRPILPGPPVLLDERAIEVRWSSAGIPGLEVRAPESAAVGSVVNVTTLLADRSNKNLRGRVIALVGSGVEVVSQLAEGRDEAGLRFALAEIGGDKKSPINDLAITSREPGERRVRVELRDGDKVQAAKEVMVRFIQPRLSVEKTFPEGWRVGQQAEYSIRVKNVGDVAADQVTIEDEIPAGLHVDATDGVRFVDRIRWKLARLMPGQETIVRTTATPARTFERLAVRTWADDTLSPRVETFDVLDVRGMETVEVALADVSDPVALAGEALYDIEVLNRGTAPAESITLSAELSKHLRATSATGDFGATVRDGRVELGRIDRLDPGQRLVVRVRTQAIADGDARISLNVQHPSLGTPGLLQQESTRIYRP